MSNRPAIEHGPKSPQLWNKTLGAVVDEQAEKHPDRTALIYTWQKRRFSYRELADRSKQIAKSLLAIGLKHGETVGIIAGNCYPYNELFVACARIGVPLVVFNNTYTDKELSTALATATCRALFIATKIGPRDMSGHIQRACQKDSALSNLKFIITLNETNVKSSNRQFFVYDSFVSEQSKKVDDATLKKASSKVKPDDTINLQFTSGTTGAPKAAMLTHTNLVNNGFLVGNALNLNGKDNICCAPPLFHCFGLVMGFLAAVTFACTITFPGDQFDPYLVLDGIVADNCTVLYGVPTMFLAEIAAKKDKGYKITSLKTGLAAGASVPVSLMKSLDEHLGIKSMLIAYGMTETSPVTFMTLHDHPLEKKAKTVGKVMPHSGAKVIDKDGKVAGRGVRGELCTCGYALQKGYWNNEAKTKEAMKTDENGVLWMHTGDEAIMDDEGYCAITGRIKDMIIRGGENIFPLEIEDRLMAHDAIAEASVVGIKDDYYGEVVGAFLKAHPDARRPGDSDIVTHVRQSLGNHKSPKYVFWIGDPEIGEDFPKTGSGKHQKHIMRALGDKLVAKDKRKGGKL